MNKKLTPWFPGSVKPTRKGVYKRDDSGLGFLPYSFWNGSYWGWSRGTARQAQSAKAWKSSAQTLPWRGLASDPGARK
jgi:hypothetical protein